MTSVPWETVDDRSLAGNLDPKIWQAPDDTVALKGEKTDRISGYDLRQEIAILLRGVYEVPLPLSHKLAVCFMVARC